jgi:hypothetical protein
MNFEFIQQFSTEQQVVLMGISAIGVLTLVIRLIRRAIGYGAFLVASPILYGSTSDSSFQIAGQTVTILQAVMLVLGFMMGLVFLSGIRRFANILTQLISVLSIILIAFSGFVIFQHNFNGQAQVIYQESVCFLLAFLSGVTVATLVRLVMAAIPFIAFSAVTVLAFYVIFPNSLNLLKDEHSTIEVSNIKTELFDQIISKFRVSALNSKLHLK